MRLAGWLVGGLIMMQTGCSAVSNVHDDSTTAYSSRTSGAELRSTMIDLHRHLRALDHSLVAPIDPLVVVRSLQQLENTAKALQSSKTSGKIGNLHPQLNDFLHRVQDAKNAASNPQPVYAQALTIVDRCAQCHRSSH